MQKLLIDISGFEQIATVDTFYYGGTYKINKDVYDFTGNSDEHTPVNLIIESLIDYIDEKYYRFHEKHQNIDKIYDVIESMICNGDLGKIHIIFTDDKVLIDPIN